jgi:hypothetical protein
MQKQELIYDRPRPVTKERHGGWSVDISGNFGFAREINAVPLAATEFEIAAREYPIVFTEAGGSVSPTVLLGLRDGENLFVDSDGGWSAGYIPAFIRRYPFVFAHVQKTETYTLCIDEASDRCNEEHRGEPLFVEDGEVSPYLQNMLDLLKKWERATQDSQAFCARIGDLELLQPSEIKFKAQEGQPAKTGGFLTVNRDRLRALPAKTVSKMHKNGDLGRIHAHLLSLHGIQSLHEALRRLEPPH